MRQRRSSQSSCILDILLRNLDYRDIRDTCRPLGLPIYRPARAGVEGRSSVREGGLGGGAAYGVHHGLSQQRCAARNIHHHTARQSCITENMLTVYEVMKLVFIPMKSQRKTKIVYREEK